MKTEARMKKILRICPCVLAAFTFSGCADDVLSVSGSDGVPPIGPVVVEPDYPEFEISSETMFRGRGEVVGADKESAKEKSKARAREKLEAEVHLGWGVARLAGRGRLYCRPIPFPQGKIIWREPAERCLPDGTWRVVSACELPRSAVAEASSVRPSPYDSYVSDFGDSGFSVTVSGLKNRFVHDERASVGVLTGRDAYLSVFWIDKNGLADVVLSGVPVKAGRTFHDDFKWRFVMLDPSLPEEFNRLIFFVTTEPRAFSRPDSATDGRPFSADVVDEWISSFEDKTFAGHIVSFSIVPAHQRTIDD